MKEQVREVKIEGRSNFNFQGTKTLYQNNFNHIACAFFFTLFEGYKCYKFYEITPKKRFSWEPEKINFKIFKFHKKKSYYDDFT